MSLPKILFRLLQGFRYRRYLHLLDPKSKTLIDFGCETGEFVRLAREKGFDARGTDIENDVTRARDRADIVTCFQVLEHLPDPITALRNLAGLYQRQLIISVPHEPWFSIWRLGFWEREHLWALTPAALEIYLGRPAFEQVLFFGRYYVAVWNKPL